VECLPNFNYSSTRLSLSADLGCSCVILCSLSIFIPSTVHPVTQCAPDPFHLYLYLCDRVYIYIYIYIYIYTCVHIIPRLVLLPLGGFLLLFHSIFIYTYLNSSLILLLPKLSFFALWCTEPLPIPPCHLLSSL